MPSAAADGLSFKIYRQKDTIHITKKQAIDIISKCAKLYHKYLENYQIVFVYRDANNHSAYTEVQFKTYNFLHFTGVIPRAGLNANDFYRHALNSKISEQDFSFKDNHTTELKLQILDITKKCLPKALLNQISPSLLENEDSDDT